MTRSSVTISRVTRLPVSSDDNIHDFSIDIPQNGHAANALYFDVAGWIIGNTQPVLSIEVVCHDFVLCRIPVSLARIDVAKHHKVIDWAGTSGYHGQVNTLGLPKLFRLSLQAVFRGRNESERVRVPFAHIDGAHSGLESGYVAKRQPLMITALGRSGTTWLMHLLSGANEIAAATSYPYEIRVGVYWMQVLQVLSSPGNHAQSTSPDGFETNIFNIGSNPYFHPAYLSRLDKGGALGSWFSQKYINDLARFCQQSIDQYYDVLMNDGSTDQSCFFMEKNLGGHIPWVYSNTYEAPREIVLIRDFRDMFCSSRAFNEKRGFAAFGKQIANSDEEWIRNRYRGVKKLVDSWKDRKDQAFLLRYEDLILRPEESLKAIFDYLGLESSSSRAIQLLKNAKRDTPEMKTHRTTRDPASSIGRWKKDMDEDTRRLFDSVFGEVLAEFGYS